MRRGRILLVDDDPDVVHRLASSLSGDGYDVSSASDGLSCMAQLRREDPDLVVLDLEISAGGGYRTLERLRDNPHWARLPVVVLTTRQASEARACAMRAGASALLATTAEARELLDTISRLVDDEPPTQ